MLFRFLRVFVQTGRDYSYISNQVERENIHNEWCNSFIKVRAFILCLI